MIAGRSATSASAPFIHSRARSTRTNRAPTLQPPPDAGLLTVVLTRLQNLPTIRAG